MVASVQNLNVTLWINTVQTKRCVNIVMFQWIKQCKGWSVNIIFYFSLFHYKRTYIKNINIAPVTYCSATVTLNWLAFLKSYHWLWPVTSKLYISFLTRWHQPALFSRKFGLSSVFYWPVDLWRDKISVSTYKSVCLCVLVFPTKWYSN